MSYDGRNCNFSLSHWCHSTMAKQIKVVHDVHIGWSRYASMSITKFKPLKGTQINYTNNFKS